MATAPNRTYVITKNSSAQWTTSNPVLANLEIGVERDSNFFKIGNGIHAWNALPYAISAGARGLIIFVSEDPDNILAYGQDGGFKLAAEYFNAIVDYTNGKTGASNIPVPTKPYNQTIFTVGRDIKDILLDISNMKHKLDLITSAVTIKDGSTTATDATWSVAKIVDQLLQSQIAVKNDLLDNHVAAYNALSSLAAYLASDPNLATSLATELGNMVRFNTGQSLTVVQKGQARDNIGAASKEDLGDPVDLVAEYTAALGTTTGSTFIERMV